MSIGAEKVGMDVQADNPEGLGKTIDRSIYLTIPNDTCV